MSEDEAPRTNVLFTLNTDVSLLTLKICKVGCQSKLSHCLIKNVEHETLDCARCGRE